MFDDHWAFFYPIPIGFFIEDVSVVLNVGVMNWV